MMAKKDGLLEDTANIPERLRDAGLYVSKDALRSSGLIE
jgi:hypothetical protein